MCYFIGLKLTFQADTKEGGCDWCALVMDPYIILALGK